MKRLIILLLCASVCWGGRKLTTNEATILAVGPFVDATDGVTPETGMTVTNITVELLVEYDDGSEVTLTTFSPTAEAAGTNDMWLVDSGGASASAIYNLELTAAQLNFTGTLTVTIIDTDVMCPWFREYTITSANAVDSEYGTDLIQTDNIQVGGTAQTANDNGADINAILVDTGEIGVAGAGLTEAGGDGDHLNNIDLPNQTMDITGSLSGSVGSVTGAVGSVTGAVGSVAAGGITASSIATDAIGADEIADDAIDAGAFATNAISADATAADYLAEINAEVLDVLSVDTWAEPAAGAPPTAPTIAEMGRYLYALSFHARLTTSSEDTIRNYADSGDLFDTPLSDDGTTFTRDTYTAP